jgi:CRP-like cAMP-binding protein
LSRYLKALKVFLPHRALLSAQYSHPHAVREAGKSHANVHHTCNQLSTELVVQTDAKRSSFDVMGLLAQHNARWSLSKCKENEIVYSQGDPADSVFYVHAGQVKVTVISKLGKEAVVAIRGPNEFCGEGALNGTPLRLATTTTMSPCEIIRLETPTIFRLLHENQKFADYFLTHLLTRTARVEADLVDQLFHAYPV